MMMTIDDLPSECSSRTSHQINSGPQVKLQDCINSHTTYTTLLNPINQSIEGKKGAGSRCSTRVTKCNIIKTIRNSKCCHRHSINILNSDVRKEIISDNDIMIEGEGSLFNSLNNHDASQCRLSSSNGDLSASSYFRFETGFSSENGNPSIGTSSSNL